jgi:urease accessory protein
MSTTRFWPPTGRAGMQQVTIWLIAAAALLPGVALAHTGVGIAGGFLSGFTHPIFGFDHVVAMVAVGLWGAFLGQPAIWLLPVVFPVVMAFGGLAWRPM